MPSKACAQSASDSSGAKPSAQLSDMGEPMPMTGKLTSRGQRACTQSLISRKRPCRGVSMR